MRARMQLANHRRTLPLPGTDSPIPNQQGQRHPCRQSAGGVRACQRARSHRRSTLVLGVVTALALSACSTSTSPTTKAAAGNTAYRGTVTGSRATTTTTAAPVTTSAPTTTTPAVTSTTAASAPASSVGIDYSSPQAVCDGFTSTIFASNAVTDAGYGAAYVRADPYVTVAMMNPPSNNAFPSAQWDRWVAHQAHAVVTVTPASAGHPSDTPTTADRGAMATVQAHGANGWSGTPAYWTVFCTLAKGTPGVPANQWRVASMQEQLQPPAVTTAP